MSITTFAPVRKSVTTTPKPPARLLLLGAGTVGLALAELASRRGVAEVEAALVRDASRPRGPVSAGQLHTDAARLSFEGTDACVEALGGIEPALSIARRVIKAGIPYITANKTLIAAHGSELQALARRHGTTLHFEAAVGGAVPCIRVLRNGLRGAGVRRLYGELNGTSHFILDEWRQPGGSFDGALREAQRRGYAEAQPDADLSGADAAQKLSILHWLVAGRLLGPDEVARVALPTLRPETISGLAAAGFAVKPAACVSWGADGTPDAWVAPAAVPHGSLLAATTGATASIVADTECAGTLLLAGPGAGGEATASALLDDLLDALAGRGGGLLPPSAVHGAATDPRSWVVHIPGGCSLTPGEVVAHAKAHGGGLRWHFPAADGGCVALIDGLRWVPGVTAPFTEAGACVLEVLE